MFWTVIKVKLTMPHGHMNVKKKLEICCNMFATYSFSAEKAWPPGNALLSA